MQLVICFTVTHTWLVTWRLTTTGPLFKAVNIAFSAYGPGARLQFEAGNYLRFNGVWMMRYSVTVVTYMPQASYSMCIYTVSALIKGCGTHYVEESVYGAWACLLWFSVFTTGACVWMCVPHANMSIDTHNVNVCILNCVPTWPISEATHQSQLCI